MLISLYLSFILFSSKLTNLFCLSPTYKCPNRCKVGGMQYNTLSRLQVECPSTNTFFKCSTSLWLNINGTVDAIFDGDLSAPSLNNSLAQNVSDPDFYHHTQIQYYQNVPEIRVYIHHSCANQDDCSRTFAEKMADQLLGYQFTQLDQRVRPFIYDATAKSETKFSTDITYRSQSLGEG